MRKATRNRTGLRRITLVVVASALVACANVPEPPNATDSYPARVATAWFDLYLDLVQTTPGFSPPVASRVFGYAGVTLYEAVVPGMAGHQSLAGQLNALTPLPQPETGADYHWPTVANSALATITRRLFANATADRQAAIDALEQKHAAEFGALIEPAIAERSIAYGRTVAEAVYAWSMTDGGHEGYMTTYPADYTPPGDSGQWQPTPPRFQPALQPYWGTHRPFVLASGSECAPPPPPEYSERQGSAFYREALEVYDTVDNLTPEQKTIALFWADDPGRTPTPPGHSIAIVSQVLKQQNASLAVAAEAYAKAGIAVADSFIACWNTKYEYNLLRPITYIRKLIDAEWTSPIGTPPFPEYTSGHSVQSNAVAFVLTGLFGDQVGVVDPTHVERGFAPREFNSFFAAAQEAAISRLYGGIHYRSAIERGLEQGKCIGEKINALRLKK
jgi:hypothetical protein